MNICDNDTFNSLEEYSTTIKNNDPVLSTNISQAKTLYENAKFYYQAAELQGSLVSYSCAAILLDSIRRSIEHNGGNNYPPAAASSPETSQESSQSSNLSDNQGNNVLADCVNILSCCLNAVEELQQKVRSSGGSSGGNKDDEEVKDWDKICVKNQPLTFNKGSSDCLFFSDVIGLEREKKIVESSLIYPLVYPNLYPKASKGILIYGPPGTGKTYMVKAAVNQLQEREPSVGVLFFAPSPGDLKGKYVGETEKRIEEIFTCASRAACKYELETCVATKKKYISILFMDEMDAIGPNRDRDTTGLAANSVNTLLQMMDGIKSFANVAVVAATNYPWNLDDAILRRFDTQILIDIPTENDIFKLLTYEMKNYITLKVDKTGYSYCEEEKKKSSKGKSKDQIKTMCQIECERKVVKDLYLEAPYNKLYIDFFEDTKKKNGIISQIAADIASKGFSNSDVNRLMKAAATNAGELAVKSNLFYSTKLIDDHDSDKYISSLTKIKNERLGILQSLKVMMSFYKNDPLDSNFYQSEKPTYAYIIDERGWISFNTKCILYKSEHMLDDPLIKNTYIPFFPTDASNIILDYMNNDNIPEQSRLIRWYKHIILGYKLNTKKMKNAHFSNVVLNIDFNTRQELTGDDVFTDENMFIKKQNKRYEKDTINTVLEFDITFIKTNEAKNINSLAIIPKSDILINMVTNPIYNAYRTAQQYLKQLNETQPETGDAWIKSAFPGIKDIKDINDNTNIFNFEDPSSKIININDAKTAALNAAKKAAINKSKQTDNVTDVITAAKNAIPNIPQDIKTMIEKIIEKPKTINPDCTEADIIVAIESIQPPPLLANSDFIIDPVKAITTVEFSNLEGNIIEKLNDIFGDIKFNELDFYNYLRLCQAFLKINVAKEAEDKLNDFSNGIKLFSTYINCFSDIQGSTKLITDIDVQEIDLNNNNNFRTQLLEKKLLSVTLNKKNKKLGSTTDSMTENLLFNIEEKIYYITLKEFKSLINYWQIYDKMTILGPNVPNVPIDPSSNYYIKIHKDFFQIMFKDIFEIDSKYFNPYDMKKVKFCETTTQKLIQLYIDDVIKFYKFGKTFDFIGLQPYMLKLYMDELIKPDVGIISIINSICLRVYDNYVLSNTQMLYVLGKPYPADDNDAKNAEDLKTEAINSNVIGFGGSINRFKTLKNIKNKKNTSLRNTKQKGGVVTIPAKKINDTQDQGVDKQYKDFLRFCINNSETPLDNSSKNIANKSIFISTKFDIEKIKYLRRTSALFLAGRGIANLVGRLSGYIANWVNKDYGEAQANKEESFKNEILQELKTSKMLLPSIFKTIYSIGFLIEKTDKKFKDSNSLDIPLTFFGTDTLDDFKISSGKKQINWINFDKYRGLLSLVYDAFFGIVYSNPDNWPNTILNILATGYAAVSTGTAISSGAELIGASYVGTPLAALGAGLAGITLASTIIQSIYACWDPEIKNKDQVIENALNSVIFDLVTSIRIINVETLEINPSILFLNYIDDQALSACDTLRLDGDKTSFNYISSEQMNIVTKQPRFHANVLQMTIKYGNLFRGSETKTDDIKGLIPRKKEENSWPWKKYYTGMYIEDEAAVTEVLETIKNEATIKPILYPILSYDDKTPEIPGIKSKLKNLNIPFSSFYYALSVVKSTYNPETGKMLKSYYADKTKFMQEYGKKLEK